MDLDPFEPVGIGAPTMRVLDLFLLHCLLADSADDSPEEIARLANNQHLAAARGREPGLRLECPDGGVLLLDWALELLDGCRPIATAVDRALGGQAYADALAAARATLAAPQALPSARVLDVMAHDFGNSYTGFVRAQSVAARAGLLARELPDEVAARYSVMADESVLAQRGLEDADTLPFEDYRREFLAPARLGL